MLVITVLVDSFIQFLSLLSFQYVHQTDEGWWGKEDEPLTGFAWKGGSERDTSGIWMWSELFKYDDPSGQKIAIALMDTQGTFDSQSTVRENATIFALSTMLSSVLIFNLSQNIQEDDLQHLQLFTEYGRLALADTGKKPFQRLQFLVRDWSFPYDAEYGSVGGAQILRRRLEIHDNQHPELQSLRKHITSCFDELACFLMPHPGLKVATHPTYNGRLADVEAEFKQQLKILVPMIFAPENLIAKKINGQVVRCRDLVQYFLSYMNIYKGDDLPEPKTMLVATAEANNLAAVSDAKETYMQMMEEICGGQKPYMKSAELEIEHLRVKDKAIEQFNAKRKMGGDEFSEAYRDKLVTDIDDAFANFQSHNENKNIFKSARTPAVYFVIAIIGYVLSGIFGLLGIYTFANFCNLIMGSALLTLALWAYIRFSGEFRKMGESLDDVAEFLWANFFRPVYQDGIKQGMTIVANNPQLLTGGKVVKGERANNSTSSERRRKRKDH